MPIPKILDRLLQLPTAPFVETAIVEFVCDACAQWPDVTWIMCDTGGPYLPDAWEALRVAFTFENVYVEVSKTQHPIITEAVRGIGAERVIYGSDWVRPESRTFGPFHFRGVYQHWWSLNQVAMADITEDQRDMILYKNAMRLLKDR